MTPAERKKGLFSVFFVAGLENFGFGLVFILFAPLILHSSLGMVPPDVTIGTRNVILGLLFAVFPISQLIGAPLFGDFADRFGRKNTFYLTIVGTVVGFAFSAIAIEMKSLSFLVISRLLSGFFAGNLSICLAAAADLSPDEKSRGENYGIITVVLGISWTAAMLVGGYLSDPKNSSYFSPALPFWVATLLSVFGLFVLAKLFTETHPTREKIRFDLNKGLHDVMLALRLKAMRLFFFILLLWVMSWGLSAQWYGAVNIEKFGISQEKIAWYLIFQGAFWMLGGSVINPLLLRRFSSRSVALIGLALATFFLAACSFAQSSFLFSLLYWMGAAGAALAMSNVLNLISISAPAQIQGKAMGLSQSVMSLGWFFVPLLGAGLGEVSVNFYYPATALFMGAGLWFLWRGKKKGKQ